MYDTLACYIALERSLSPELFGGRSVVEELDGHRVRSRMWLESRDEDVYRPRVTYWPDGNVLKLEFSVSKMASCPDTRVADADDLERALHRVDAFVFSLFGRVPSIVEWTVTRMDYYYQWWLGERLPQYLAVLRELRMANGMQSVYRGAVYWKTASRWVKFYDKSRECGCKEGLLRFEVSNMNRAVRYLADTRYDGDRSVRMWLTPERARDVMHYVWASLNLHVESYEHERVQQARVRALWPRSSAAAVGALRLIRSNGIRCVHDGMMGKSAYYRWRKRFVDAGLMSHAGDECVMSLPALQLP